MEKAQINEITQNVLKDVAEKMVVAAITAPKAKGKSLLDAMVVYTDDIQKIADKMEEMYEEEELGGFFLRDAKTLRDISVMVLLGTEISSMSLRPCGMCGFENCDEKDRHPEHPCVFNTGDLGIAIGSAVTVAMENRIDNRILYTAGQAVKRLEMMGEDTKIIYGIPLSATKKSPFFDRKK